jgi:phage shock protein PspC (stress-responsive transcriptional regulator)
MSAVVQVNSLPPPDTIRAVTREVLAQPEFTEPSRWYEALIEFLKAIKEWLDGLSAWSEANPTLARVLFVLALLILIACLAHLLYLALADVLPFGRKRDAKTAPAAHIEILEGVANDWREALQVARRMLAENDPRRAIWIVHRVLLGLLDQQGAIKFAGWKTNSHYLRECAQGHPWYPTFAELSEIYDQAVYARRSTPANIAEALLLRVDRFYGEAAGPG